MTRSRAVSKSRASALIAAQLLLCGFTLRALEQQGAPVNFAEVELPSAPEAVGAGADAEGVSSAELEENSKCFLSGTILDTNDDVIQGARVVLTNRSGSVTRETQSGPNGQFSFEALPAGSYRVVVTGRDMGSFETPWTSVRREESRIIPVIVLPVATAISSVTVSADRAELREDLSQQQVQIAVQQRVWGVIPNFYSSYDWNAPAMLPKQKFQLAFRSMTDPMAFAGAAGIAGFQQFYGIYPGYGTGAKGFFKRYGAAYTNDFDSRMLSSGVLATLFHEDPRYFYKGTGSIPSRTFYALSRTLVTRDDGGHSRPNFSRILGIFAAAALSNLYFPSENRGVGLTLVNGAVEIGGNAGTNFAREFILKGITTNVAAKP